MMLLSCQGALVSVTNVRPFTSDYDVQTTKQPVSFSRDGNTKRHDGHLPAKLNTLDHHSLLYYIKTNLCAVLDPLFITTTYNTTKNN